MQRQEAIAYFEQKVEQDPMDGAAHHHLAVLCKSQGDLERHARHSRIAMLTNQGSGPKVRNEMALALMQQGKTQQARTLLQEVMNKWPTFPGSYANMAALAAKKGSYTEALVFCDKALGFAPQDASFHRNKAKVLEQLGRTSEALTHYQRALTLAPDDAAIAKRIALLSLSKPQQSTATAMSYYSHYRSLHGDHFDLKL